MEERLTHDFYFVGNAHLDPVWQWHWQEGSCEAKATVRSALDRMKEHPEFIFVCSAAKVFEWLAEFDPAMVEEIRQRVKEGRFVIVGGWYVQTDCNLPAGEGFARQGIYAQRYFKETFGVTATVGYNVDSFGHNAQIPQILKKQGMDSYVFMRPGRTEKDLPSHVFWWEAPDGTRVLAARLLRGYNTTRVNVNDREELLSTMKDMEAVADPAVKEAFFFYGVGNHGGGPTKKNIASIKELMRDHKEVKLQFSNVRDFFDQVRERGYDLPVVRDDLQHHASGCYAAVSAIKNGIRRAECALTSAENFAVMAWALGVRSAPDPKAFAAAWKNVLFSHFHDSFGGCSIHGVYDDAAQFLGESRAFAQRQENNALQTLSWKIDTSDASKGVPLILFNPHPFPVETTVQLNKRREIVRTEAGEEIPVQFVRGDNARCSRVTGHTVFTVRVPALGYATYFTERDKELPPEKERFDSDLVTGEDFIENEFYKVVFEPHTGFITSFVDKKTGKEQVEGRWARPVVIDESDHDTWSHARNCFDREIGEFCDGSIRLVEAGPVRARMKVVSRFGRSTLTQFFTLCAHADQLEVEAAVDWHEHRKMLKLRFETPLSDPTAYYEIPFGVMPRPSNGEEEPGQTFTAVSDGTEGLLLLNENKYSFSAKDGHLDLTAVRSPYYIDHGRGDQTDPDDELTDQGETRFRYALLPWQGTDFSGAVRRARLFNTPVTQILENNHPGVLPLHGEGLTLTGENVMLSAIKRAEDGKGLVVRLYETAGKEAAFTLSGPCVRVPLREKLSPWSVETWYLPDGGETWKKVLMTEYDA